MIQLVTILAGADYTVRMRGLHGAFQPNGGNSLETRDIFVFLGVAIVLVVALLITRAIWRRKTGKFASERPGRLFTHALKKMGVHLPDRILLRIAARESSLPHPALMLFSPELFERYAGRWAESITVRPLRRHAGKRIQTLTKKVFA